MPIAIDLYKNNQCEFDYSFQSIYICNLYPKSNKILGSKMYQNNNNTVKLGDKKLFVHRKIIYEVNGQFTMRTNLLI